MLICFYPVWKVIRGGHLDFELPGFDPIRRADRIQTPGRRIRVEGGCPPGSSS
jgi:hypothetical protein